MTTMQQPKMSVRLGDRVRCTLDGILTEYDEDGIWTLVGSAAPGHVEWGYKLHWATDFEVLFRGDLLYGWEMAMDANEFMWLRRENQWLCKPTGERLLSAELARRYGPLKRLKVAS